MQHLTISCSLVDGSLLPLDYESGRELIQALLGDDCKPPASCLRIEAETQDGRIVLISIPNSDSGEVSVKIEEKDQG